MTFISKKLIALTILAVASSTTSFAADRGFYGQLEAGYSKSLRYRTHSDARKFVNGSGSYAPIFGGELGYAFGNNFRLGLAAYRASYDIKQSSERWDNYAQYNFNVNSFTNGKVKVQSTALMLNGYYDFPGFEHFTPYISAGAGIAFNKTSDIIAITKAYNTSNGGDTFDGATVNHIVKGKSRVSLAWNIGAGFKVPMSDKLSLNMSVRYLDYGKNATSKDSNAIYSPTQMEIERDMSSGSKLKAFTAIVGLVYKF